MPLADVIHLDLTSHPFLGDHRLSGRPVLPLASALEMMAEQADAAPPFALHDVRVERGLILFSEVADVDVVIEDGRVILRELRSKGRVIPAFSAQLGTPSETDGRPPGGGPQAAGSQEAPAADGGEAQRLRALGTRASEPQAGPLPEARSAEPSLDLDTFYRDHAYHGPRMRAVDQILSRDDTRIVGRIRTSRPTDWQPGDRRPRWRLDPLVIDGAFQLALFQSIAIGGRRMVPLGVAEVAWLRDPLDVTVTVTLSTRADDLTCDARIDDAAGCVGYLRHAWGRLI